MSAVWHYDARRVDQPAVVRQMRATTSAATTEDQVRETALGDLTAIFGGQWEVVRVVRA
jgi:hypothetical protein